MGKRTFIVLLCCLLLAGCGKQGGMEKEEVQKLSAEEETQKTPEGGLRTGETAGNSGVTGAEEKATIAVMPLLHAENPENENLADLLQTNGAGAMVQLSAGGLLGSGVIYRETDGQLLVLTAAHVLNNTEDQILVTFADGWQLGISDYECFDTVDLAVLRIKWEELPAKKLETYCCVNVDKNAFDAVQNGDGCIVMGCRTGVAAECYEGEILETWIFMEDYAQYMMCVRAEGKMGMSGGGLFDSQGHFLGILSGMDGEGEIAVVPLSLILAEVGGLR